jgi:hypothetical protein
MKLTAAIKILTLAATAALAIGSAQSTAAGATTAPTTSITINHSVIAVGSTAVISGAVSPNLRNHTVYLQSYYGKAWHSLLHVKLNSVSRYSFTVRPGSVAKYSFRAYVPPVTGVRGSLSRTVALTTQAKLTCSAHMSNARPAQHTTTDVLVKTAASAAVYTTAHYKTTNTSHAAYANSAGNADIAYDVAGGTHGYKVVVSVTVRRSPQTATCSTSFTTL